MKRLLIALVAVVAVCGTASAWAKFGHATVAKIAEQNLIPKAKKQLAEYLDGKSIVYYASHADYHKNDWLLDLGFEPSNAKRRTTYPHTYGVNDDCSVVEGYRQGDEYVKNCVYFADQKIAELKKNHRNMDSKERMIALAYVIHWLGDMHCPEHIRYPEDQTAGNYKVEYRGRQVTMHALWDSVLLDDRHASTSFSDLALLLDTFNKQQKKEITAGTIYDWGKDSALASRHIHRVAEGTKLKRLPYMNEHAPLLESQIRKAGYRLAAVLNDIFK